MFNKKTPAQKQAARIQKLIVKQQASNARILEKTNTLLYRQR